MRSKSLILTLFLALATAAGAFGQNRTITGTIRDANQEPVVGAGVLIEGTNQGTISAMDGSFSLKAPSGPVVLDVTSLGYISQKVSVGANQTVVNVVLQEDALNLEGTVVVGYGVQKKVNLTGAISSVTSRFSIFSYPNIRIGICHF